jgi:glycosyltransferase involved in cell wall biosynthesis
MLLHNTVLNNPSSTISGQGSRRKIRILALTPAFYGSTGDAVNERQLITALANMIDECFVITLVTMKQVLRNKSQLRVSIPRNMIVVPVPLPKPHVLVKRLAMIGFSALVGIIALAMLTADRVDFFYVRNSFLSPGFLVFRTLARRTIVKIPAIGEETDGELVARLAKVLDRQVLARAKRVGVVGIDLYDRIVTTRSFRHKFEPLEIRPGIDPNVIAAVARRDHNKKKTITIGFLGTLEKWQGVSSLVGAVAIVGKELPGVKLCIVGDGPLRKEIAKECEREAITYEITGHLPHEEAMSRLSAFDVLVVPRSMTPDTESIVPLKIIEAWSLGVPVVATRCKVLTSRYKDHSDVIYCELSPSGIAHSILLLLRDETLRVTLSERGRILAKDFQYDAIADKLLSALVDC